MAEKLYGVNKIDLEHQAIKVQLESVIGSIKDLTREEAGHADLRQDKSISTPPRTWELQQKISYLDEGLKSHYAREEDLLNPHLGDWLMQGIVKEHREIENYLDKVKSLFWSIQKSSSELSPVIHLQIKHAVEYLCRLIESNNLKENSVRELLGKIEV